MDADCDMVFSPKSTSGCEAHHASRVMDNAFNPEMFHGEGTFVRRRHSALDIGRDPGQGSLACDQTL